MRARAILLTLLLTTCGCHGLADYVTDRNNDLSDCTRARFALAQVGLYAEVEATDLLNPAVGFMDVSLSRRYAFHWGPDEPRDPGQVRTATFPTMLLAWPIYGHHETESGYGDTSPYLRGFVSPWILMGNHHVQERSVSLLGLHNWIPNPRLAKRPEPELRQRGWFGASLTALFVSASLGVNLIEVVDFLAGLAGLDLLGDDGREERAPSETGNAASPEAVELDAGSDTPDHEEPQEPETGER